MVRKVDVAEQVHRLPSWAIWSAVAMVRDGSSPLEVDTAARRRGWPRPPGGWSRAAVRVAEDRFRAEARSLLVEDGTQHERRETMSAPWAVSPPTAEERELFRAWGRGEDPAPAPAPPASWPEVDAAAEGASLRGRARLAAREAFAPGEAVPPGWAAELVAELGCSRQNVYNALHDLGLRVGRA